MQTETSSFRMHYACEESPRGRGPENRERTESENRLSDDRGEDEGTETRWPMTKREERSCDRCAIVDQSCSLELRRIAKVGCYLTILVKRSHYTIGLDPGVTERHGSWTLPSQSRRLPSPRRAQTPRFVLCPAAPSDLLVSACICERAS